MIDKRLSVLWVASHLRSDHQVGVVPRPDGLEVCGSEYVDAVRKHAVSTDVFLVSG